jgi:hypothetical protein
LATMHGSTVRDFLIGIDALLSKKRKEKINIEYSFKSHGLCLRLRLCSVLSQAKGLSKPALWLG